MNNDMDDDDAGIVGVFDGVGGISGFGIGGKADEAEKGLTFTSMKMIQMNMMTNQVMMIHHKFKNEVMMTMMKRLLLQKKHKMIKKTKKKKKKKRRQWQ